METLKKLYEFIIGPGGAALFFVLFALSEFIGMNEKMKSNSVFQFIKNLIKTIWEKLKAFNTPK